MTAHLGLWPSADAVGRIVEDVEEIGDEERGAE